MRADREGQDAQEMNVKRLLVLPVWTVSLSRFSFIVPVVSQLQVLHPDSTKRLPTIHQHAAHQRLPSHPPLHPRRVHRPTRQPPPRSPRQRRHRRVLQRLRARWRRGCRVHAGPLLPPRRRRQQLQRQDLPLQRRLLQHLWHHHHAGWQCDLGGGELLL